jgi:glycerol uptake facilitator-like aquaporin
VTSTRPVPAELSRRLVAELLGTMLLVTFVVGSGIAAQRLSPDDVGLQLLENSTATFLGLTVLILLFGPVSGGHFSPVVSAADWLLGRRASTGLTGRGSFAYTAAQNARRRRRRRAREPHVPGAARRPVHEGPDWGAPAARRGRGDGGAPASVPPFVVARLVGAAIAAALIASLFPHIGEVADDALVPHENPPATPATHRPTRSPR